MLDNIPQGHSVFEGWVTHERYQPKAHFLRYKLFYLLLDLDQLDSLNTLSPWWSTKRLNLVQFRRNDYMPPTPNTQTDKEAEAETTLKQAVCETIFKATQEHFNGKVFLLSNLRYWGYCFNPVSYYFCYDNDHNLRYIVDEVTNTPWKQRHYYVHKCPQKVINETLTSNNDTQSGLSSHLDDKKKHTVQFKFNKDFHVSPFMPMAMHYQTTYRLQQKKMLIHMELFESILKSKPAEKKVTTAAMQPKDSPIFYATMSLSGHALTSSKANWLPFRFPLQCSKIIIAIYWQALKLWLKRVPFFSNPSSLNDTQ